MWIACCVATLQGASSTMPTNPPFIHTVTYGPKDIMRSHSVSVGRRPAWIMHLGVASANNLDALLKTILVLQEWDANSLAQ